MTDREIIICRDLDVLSRRAAGQFVALAQQAIAARGHFSVSLSGGSTPKALSSLIATDEFKQQLAWQQIHLFWGDERCVAPGHAESNYRMVKESLLSKIHIPSGNVHRMAGELEPLAEAVAYERELKQFFLQAETNLPRFDLLLLGLGEDGHTASLFPGSSALHETKRLVAPIYVEKLAAHRLTLTLPSINHAAQISFLIAGKSKAAIVKEIFAPAPPDYPAARIQPARGRLTWFITQDAAGDLGDSQTTLE
ncbi:MAG TPA: 6-phosphogluconolactonase [Candidatus Deferrimicrobium sp.]|nr:6-phosphogluconolactonase [Candidatus Deferrimicrobium sp.]